ncbi:MAG: hypothetical protein ACI865_000249 [Flavobacteriaceae bacterium]|jgi:hypothetical protein
MGLDPRLLNYLIALNTRNLSNAQIADLLGVNGFVSSTGKIYSIQQVSSILHSVRSVQRARAHRPTDRCGIDRAKNPCGDASEY